MKRILFFTFVIFLTLNAAAQPEFTTVNFQKADRQAIINELPFPEKTIMGAIDSKMEQMGYKGKSSKGFTVYKNVHLPELGSGKYDLFFKADRLSKRNKDNSTLTLLIAVGDDNFISTQTDASLMNNAKDYLANFNDQIASYDLDQKIVDQEEVVKKSNKQFTDLQDKGASLEKDRKKIEKDIEDNKKAIEKQQSEVDNQKQILETLKAGKKQ